MNTPQRPATIDDYAYFTIDIKKCTVDDTEVATFLLIADTRLYMKLSNALSNKLMVNVLNSDTQTFGNFKISSTSKNGALVFILNQLFKVNSTGLVTRALLKVPTVFLEVSQGAQT